MKIESFFSLYPPSHFFPLFYPHCFYHPYLLIPFNFPPLISFFSSPFSHNSLAILLLYLLLLCLTLYVLSLLPTILHAPLLSASDIASDQGQVLVIVTAAVGGFTLLVILTLFLLITGR